MLAGGVESMSRAPFVMGKAESAFSRNAAIYDTTIGWRFVNKLMQARYGIDSMPETAENVADGVQESAARSRTKFALASAGEGRAPRSSPASSTPSSRRSPCRRRRAIRSSVDKDEHPAETSLEALARLKGVVRDGGTVTAGNASRRERRRGRAAAGRREERRASRPDAACPRAWAWLPPAWRRASWAWAPCPLRARCWRRPASSWSSST